MMKKMTAMLLSLLMLLTASFALAEEDGTQITVQGTATVTAAPDIVSVMANAHHHAELFLLSDLQL